MSEFNLRCGTYRCNNMPAEVEEEDGKYYLVTESVDKKRRQLITSVNESLDGNGAAVSLKGSSMKLLTPSPVIHKEANA